MKTLYAAKSIPVGVHPTFKLLGLTFDLDIIMSTLLAAAIMMFLVFRMTTKATDGVPNKLQVLWEIISVDLVGNLAESAMGSRGKRYVPLGVTLFIFILIGASGSASILRSGLAAIFSSVAPFFSICPS